MATISRKTKYIRTDGWRGYSQPINAVAGANDTGNWDDSPCPSHLCTEELNKVKAVLKKNKIPFVANWGKTTNVFCVHRYILVAPENHERAAELLQPLVKETRLLYIID